MFADESEGMALSDKNVTDLSSSSDSHASALRQRVAMHKSLKVCPTGEYFWLDLAH